VLPARASWAFASSPEIMVQLTFEVPIRGRDFPVAYVNGDGVRLCKGDGESCCEDLKDEHWAGEFSSILTSFIYPRSC
jgi:hypothetical protein